MPPSTVCSPGSRPPTRSAPTATAKAWNGRSSGLVRDRQGLEAWLATVLRHGGGWMDAVLLAHAQPPVTAGDEAGWRELRDLAQAWTPTTELALETRAQGEAFAAASLASWPDPEGRLPGLLADGPGLTYRSRSAPSRPATACRSAFCSPAYLQAFAANLVSAAVRLVPLGQTDGQRATAALEPTVREAAALGPDCPLDELGTATLMVDLCSMRHETQYTRLFRS